MLYQKELLYNTYTPILKQFLINLNNFLINNHNISII